MQRVRSESFYCGYISVEAHEVGASTPTGESIIAAACETNVRALLELLCVNTPVRMSVCRLARKQRHMFFPLMAAERWL